MKFIACRALLLKIETLFSLPLFTIILGKSKVSAPIVFATCLLPQCDESPGFGVRALKTRSAFLSSIYSTKPNQRLRYLGWSETVFPHHSFAIPTDFGKVGWVGYWLEPEVTRIGERRSGKAVRLQQNLRCRRVLGLFAKHASQPGLRREYCRHSPTVEWLTTLAPAVGRPHDTQASGAAT